MPSRPETPAAVLGIPPVVHGAVEKWLVAKEGRTGDPREGIGPIVLLHTQARRHLHAAIPRSCTVHPNRRWRAIGQR